MTILRFIAITFLFTLMITFWSGCYYDNEEELYPFESCETTNMSFTTDILPLFDQNCNVCHASSQALGNVILDSHAEVKKQVDAIRLLGAIRHEVGFSAMPQGQPQLTSCAIDKIASWVAAGAPNN